jgi:hypothetical protein
LLAEHSNRISYTPCDASLPLVITSVKHAAGLARVFHPLVCDLAAADDLAQVFDEFEPLQQPRLFTFFGIIPNFEPDFILRKLNALLRADDLLLFSANLAPGADYAAGVKQVFPGYDNRETRTWLLAFLTELGMEPDDGVIKFSIEEAGEFLRIAADFHFHRQRTLFLEEEPIEFEKGNSLRLFFSFRYTAGQVQALLNTWRLTVLEQWVTPSAEEGVFFCRKMGVDA